MTLADAMALHASVRRYGNETGKPSVALHIGAADEIDRATVLRLARSGMSVAVYERDEGRLDEMEAALESTGRSGLMLRSEPDSRSDVENVVGRTLSAFARIDALIVGMSASGNLGAGDDEPATLSWIKAVSPRIAAAGGGHIVSVVSSLARYRTSYFPYDAGGESALDRSAAEGAVVALIRQAAFELAPKKIRVNAVAVGWIRGEARGQEWRRLSERDRSYRIEEISLRRLGEPEEVAAAVEFLATPASSYVTGAVVDVNGGLWMS